MVGTYKGALKITTEVVNYNMVSYLKVDIENSKN